MQRILRSGGSTHKAEVDDEIAAIRSKEALAGDEHDM
jgi:hypothetical protein